MRGAAASGVRRPGNLVDLPPVATLPPCPICGKPVAPRPENRSAPFCSDRCRLRDLSKWLGGEYRIPGPRLGDGDGEPFDSGPGSNALRPGGSRGAGDASWNGDPDDGGE